RQALLAKKKLAGLRAFLMAASSRLSEVLGHEVPVHQVPEDLNVLRTCVAVVNVVGMFPHVASQQRLVGAGQRGRSVGGVDDLDGAVSLLHQPGPAGTEVAHAGLGEFSLEVVEGTEL